MALGSSGRINGVKLYRLAVLTGWPHKQGLIIRKYMGVSPGQIKVAVRELVKTILHARDPLLRGGGKEETMGLEG